MTFEEKRLLEEAKVDDSAYIALGDLYEEKGQLQNAAKSRKKGGISKIVYRVIRKSDNEIMVENENVGRCTAFINSQGKEGLQKYFVRMYELRYVDIGPFIPKSHEKIHKFITFKGNKPFIGDVDLEQEYLTCKGEQKISRHNRSGFLYSLKNALSGKLTEKEVKIAMSYYETFVL